MNRAVAIVDVAVEVLLVGLLAFAPLAFGAVEPWSELVVFSIGAAIAGLLVVRVALSRRAHATQASPLHRWAMLAIALYIGWVLLQLVPMPVGMLRVVSPRTVSLKSELLRDLPNAPEALRSMRVSFYPFGTRHDLGVVLLASVVFSAVITVFREPARLRRLLVWVTLIGGMIALLALAQDVTKSQALYWRLPIGGLASSGPFINHSHFSQFMNLSIGAALALVLAGFADSRWRTAALWWSGPIIVMSMVAVAVSLSRGGLLSMLVAGALTLGIALLRGGGMRRVALVLLTIAILGFGALLYVGFDRVYERATTTNTPLDYRGRVQMIADALRAWRDFPVTGVGLGAHEMVFLVYERSLEQNAASHVENEYAQALEETGVVGFVIVCAFALMIWWRYARAVRSASPVAIGLGYGLAAVMVHSLSDYGQHVPAVACLSAVICGLIVNLSARSKTVPKPGRAAVNVLCAVVCLLLSIWVVVEAWGNYRADRNFEVARRIYERLRAREWKGSDADYREMVANARDATRLAPGNIEYRRWLGTYEWRALARNRNAQGELVLSGADVVQVERIVDELHQARRLAPTYAPIYYIVGQLEDLVLDRPAGAEHIRRANALWRNEPQALMLVAEIDARQGRFESADEKLRRAIAIRPNSFADAANLYIKQLNRPEHLLELFDGNWQQLLRAAWYLNEAGRGQLAIEARDRAAVILKPLADRPDAPLAWIAQMAEIRFEQQKFDQAAEYYERASKLDYGQVYYHSRRARCLINLGRLDEARSEISATLSIDPNHQGAKDMLREIQAKR